MQKNVSFQWFYSVAESFPAVLFCACNQGVTTPDNLRCKNTKKHPKQKEFRMFFIIKRNY